MPRSSAREAGCPGGCVLARDRRQRGGLDSWGPKPWASYISREVGYLVSMQDGLFTSFHSAAGKFRNSVVEVKCDCTLSVVALLGDIGVLAVSHKVLICADMNVY